MFFKKQTPKQNFITLFIFSLVLILGLFLYINKDKLLFSADVFDLTQKESIQINPDIVPVEGELLIKFKKNVSKEEKQKFFNQYKARTKEEIKALGIELIAIDTQNSPEQKAKSLRQQETEKIEFVEPNYPYYLAETIPDDPLFVESQWGLHKIQAPLGWDISVGDESMVVAVLDTGANFAHQDLATRLLPGYDFFNYDSDPTDDNGHGSIVTGIIGAITNNNIGVAGTSWNNKVMPLKVCSASGSCALTAIANAITYAADNGARVISMSFTNSMPSTTMKSAIDYAYDKGVLSVAATGNNNYQYVLYPAAYPNTLAVGASGSSDQRESYSNYGTSLDCLAPGSATSTTSSVYSTYGSMGGTSVSAPFASGLAGLIFSVNQALSPLQVMEIIRQGADDIAPAGWDIYSGYGRINVNNSLVLASNEPPIVDRGSITGRVLESGTSIPVVGASVAVKKSGTTVAEVQTVSDGSFFFSLQEGNYDLSVSASGYDAQIKTGIIVISGQTTTNDFYLVANIYYSNPLVQGWHLLGFPAQPETADPEIVFEGLTIDGRLYSWDGVKQNLLMYDEWSPELFGQIMPLRGYWLRVGPEDVGKKIAYTGSKIITTQIIDLEVSSSGGWLMLANPFDHNLDINSKLYFYERVNKKYSYAEAISRGWIESTMYWWDSASQSLKSAGSSEFYPESEEMKTWHGYWLKVKRSGLKLELRP